MQSCLPGAHRSNAASKSSLDSKRSFMKLVHNRALYNALVWWNANT